MKHTTHSVLALVLLTACGEVTAKLSDAAPVDDTGGPADASPKVITARALTPEGLRNPTANVMVVFTNPDGSSIVRRTNAEGIATAEAAPHATVSAIWYTGQYNIVSVVDVSPGETVELSGRGEDYRAYTQMKMVWPSHAAGEYYYATNPCNYSYSNTTSVLLDLYENCRITGGKADIGVIARNSMTGQTTGYLENLDVPFTDGGTVTLAGTYTSPATFSANYTHVNTDEMAYLYTSRYTLGGHGWSTNGGVQVTAATVPMSFEALTSARPAIVSTYSYLKTDGNSYQYILQHTNGASLAYNFDMAENLAPWLMQPSFDAATHKVVAPVQGTKNATFAAVSAQVRFQHLLPNDGGNGRVTILWDIIAPSLDKLVLPTLPAEADDVAITPADIAATAPFVQQVTGMQSEGLTDYNALKSQYFSLQSHYDTMLELAGDKIIRLVSYYQY